MFILRIEIGIIVDDYGNEISITNPKLPLEMVYGWVMFMRSGSVSA